jgi:hypothetical protein
VHNAWNEHWEKPPKWFEKVEWKIVVRLVEGNKIWINEYHFYEALN